jgi:hypothetical protein
MAAARPAGPPPTTIASNMGFYSEAFLVTYAAYYSI